MVSSYNAYLKAVSTKITDNQLIMNRNTSPKRPLTDEDIIDAVLNTNFNQYPEEEEAKFIQAYASYNDLDPQKVALANGSDEWLQKLVIQFGQGGVLALETDFFMYEEYTRQLEYPFYTIECDEDFNYDLADIIDGLDQFKPSLLFISNPQNPTGKQFSGKYLQALADATEVRGIIFVLDEAYIEFGDDYKRPDNENVVIIRTLSKIYGSAGLRLGIAIGKGKVFKKLNQINHPYPVNSISLNIASKLFEQFDELDKWTTYQKNLKDQLVLAFEAVADVITLVPSYANFVFIYGDKVPSLVSYLSDKGYVGRTYEGEKLAKAVRYSIVDKEHYEQLAIDIKEWRSHIED